MRNFEPTETYRIPQKDGSHREYTRVTTKQRILLDQQMRERGYEKEYITLANGKRGFRWR